MLVLLSLAAAPAVWAETVVGDGKPASQSRTVADFNAIALNGSIALKLKQGNTASVVVRGDSNLLSLVETVVESNQSLQLRWKRGTSVRSQVPVVVEVTAPQVRAVASAGSGDIEIDAMKVPRLSLSIKGSADLRASGCPTSCGQPRRIGRPDVGGQARACPLSSPDRAIRRGSRSDDVTSASPTRATAPCALAQHRRLGRRAVQRRPQRAAFGRRLGHSQALKP